MARFLAATLAALMVAPAALAWSDAADGTAEPSTPDDIAEYMHQAENAAASDKVYFNGYVTTHVIESPRPVTSDDRFQTAQLLRHRALLGFWRDCNADGFIGSALLGSEEYPSLLGVDLSVCPEGSTYNKNGLVTEFLWIGPDANGNNSGIGEEGDDDNDSLPVENPLPYRRIGVGDRRDGRGVNDSKAKVWSDFGRPTDVPRITRAIFPFPHGSLSSWEGHAGYGPHGVASAVPTLVNDTGAGCLSEGTLGDRLGDARCSLPDLGVTYDEAYAAGRQLDGLGVPSPVAAVKNLYNNSRTDRGGQQDCGSAGNACTGAYAQPLVYVFDCSAPQSSAPTAPFVNLDGSTDEMYVSPAINPTVNPDGSIDGTYYQLGRAYLLDDDSTTGGKCGPEGGNLPYSNLERPTQGTGAEQTLKRSTSNDFTFAAWFRTYEVPENERDETYYPIPYTGLLDGHEYRAGYHGYEGALAGGWSSNTVYLRLPNAAAPEAMAGDFRRGDWHTYYSYVSNQAFTDSGFPSAAAFPGSVVEHRYGAEQCPGGFGAAAPNPGAWDCNPAKWDEGDPLWGVAVGQVYQLRDTDCYDNTLAGFTTPRPSELGWSACVPGAEL